MYSIEEITALTGAHVLSVGKEAAQHAEVEWLLTDSRSLKFPEKTLFFAIKTGRGDGARYIPQLYARGVRNFVVSELPTEYEERYVGSHFLMTPNPLMTLQRLAQRHREKFDIPVVGITGSNGKTVVKEWLYELLRPDFAVTRSPRSYNSQIGVPLSVWLLTERSQMGLFEAGISQVGEMARLQDIIQPTLGILTNIGEAHQENFRTKREKCKEKLALFEECAALVCNGDDALVGECLQEVGFAGTLLTWSRQDRDAYVYVCDIVGDDASTVFRFLWKGQEREARIPFSDAASLENAVSSLTAALYLGIDADAVVERLARLEAVAMRMEVKQGMNGCTLVNDSYNSDLHSLDIALDFVNRRQDRQERRLTLVLSDILQSGLSDEELYAAVNHLVEGYRVDCLVGIGEAMGRQMSQFRLESRFFSSTEELLQSGFLQSLHDQILLIKGARSFGFDRISTAMEMRVHQTILEVNLNVLVENLNYYRNMMRPETKMVCMVKASAYGAGAVEIARTLQEQRVDYLAVAVADEGVTLRKAGITQGIMVMNPEIAAFREILEAHLEPEVYSFALLEAFISAVQREGLKNWPVHIKLDTGMHRLGFHPEKDMERLVDILRNQDAVMPRSVFSHFVGSDSETFDDFTTRQFALFSKAANKLQAAVPNKILRHICNSAAIERFPQFHLDMVRLGIGLYGINPVTNQVMSNVSTLKSVILQTREVEMGETVGYSRKGKVVRPSKIAAVPIGYADGLNRHLGNGAGYCLVNGKQAAYVGNICMDVCMIDVTDIDCKEGDEVVIFGTGLPVTQLSDTLQTIPYEVLTSVSERVARVYYQD